MKKNPDTYYRQARPSEVISLDTMMSIRALHSLNMRAESIVDFMPWRAQSALKLLSEAIKPHTDVLDLDHIFQMAKPPSTDDAPLQPTTLLSLFKHLLTTHNFSPDYDDSAEFYTRNNETYERLPSECQTAIATALNRLQGIQFYLDDLAEYWHTTLEQSRQTNLHFLASCLALHIQLISTVSMKDGSLPLSGGALITLLSSDSDLPNINLYRVAITSEADGDLWLAGAFIIMRHFANFPSEDNPCVLYVPGDNLKYFDSPDSLKDLLCAAFKSSLKSKLLSCIAKAQHSSVEGLIKKGLTKTNIDLKPTQFSQRFFYDQTLQLVNVHQQNIRYLWANASTDNKQKTYWSEHLTSDMTQAFKSWVTFSKPYIGPKEPIENTPPSPPAKEKTLKPINIHVYLHNDLTGKYSNASLLENYFSWVQAELKDITQREIHVNIISTEKTQKLRNYNYKHASSAESVYGWKKQATRYLKSNSQSLSPLDLHLLLTNDDVNIRILGVAIHPSEGGQFAVASTTSYRTAAHEIGHLLGATHENGAVIYNGWWHNTLMKSPDFFFLLRGSAYRFSDDNREAIANHLKQFN